VPDLTGLALPKEPWKFTNLPRAVASLECTPLCTTIGCLEAALPIVSGPQMVFHNGELSTMLSGSATLAVGATLHTDIETLNTTPVLDALDELPSTASNHHIISISGKVQLPLHLIHVASGDPSTSRFTINIKEGAEVTLIEHQVAAPHFTTWQNLSVVINVATGAKVTHSILQTLPPTCLLTRRSHVNLADGATYANTTLQQGAALARIETHATLATSTSFSHIGLSLSRRQQHHSNLLHVRHKGEANQTHIRQRNLIDDSAHSAFQGKFHVEQLAQKTNAYMHCHNLLLNDTARTSHKPELEIYADDVKCSHGAATGGLHPQQLFYLQARGFTPQAARALLTVGFAQEFIAEFPEVMRKNLETGLQHYLADHMETADPTPDFGMDPIRRDEGTTYARVITDEETADE
jgi:Fe-S cluster assembly protein SufD